MSTTFQSMKAGFFRYFTQIAHARVRQELLYRDDEFLASAGISRQLLEQGINAWPWRLQDAELESQPQPPEQNTEIAVSKREYAKAVAELNGYSDAELADLGISRGSIKYAVRHGRPGIDYGLQRDAA